MYYESHFGLNEPPFSISPDPRYLYLTAGHREALAHLLYGVTGGGGFVLLTGEIGAGKTTVCRCLLQQLPEDVDVALVLNPRLDVLEFLETICDELGIKIHGNNELSFKLLIDYIYKHLLVAHSQGRNTVLIVDEAQNLSPEVIEHLRLLTNLETDEKKLLQIILIGQPELRDLLGAPALRQMAQRITARFHLNLLSGAEAQGYIEHRLKVAGSERQLFDLRSIKYIWRRSGGVPRLMNAICDRALLGASVANQQKVNVKIANKAAFEVLGEQVGHQRRATFTRPLRYAVLILSLATVAIMAFMYFPKNIEIPMIGDRFSGFDTRAAGSGHEVSGPGTMVALQESEAEVGIASRVSEANLNRKEEADFLSNLLGSRSANLNDLERSAHSNLFKRWGITHTSQSTQLDCDYAKTIGLACLSGRGNLQTLTMLNRPSVIALRGESGRIYKAALTSLSEDTAVINLSDTELTVSLDKLRELWTGEYLVMWRPPENYTRIVKAGMEGDVVEWIARRLTGNGGEVVRVYGPSVVNRVRLFQQVYGLVPDGEVGPMTLIAINNFAGSSAPKLKHLSASELTVATE